MSKEKTRPGVLLYFDLLKSVDKLSDEEAGILLKAIYHYAVDGTRPTFDSDKLDVLWPLVEDRVDQDDVNYHEKAENKAYGPYCREARRNGEPVLARDEWLAQRSVDSSEDPYTYK